MRVAFKFNLIVSKSIQSANYNNFQLKIAFKIAFKNHVFFKAKCLVLENPQLYCRNTLKQINTYSKACGIFYKEPEILHSKLTEEFIIEIHINSRGTLSWKWRVPIHKHSCLFQPLSLQSLIQFRLPNGSQFFDLTAER